MKKTIKLLSVFALAFTMAACGEDKTSTPTSTTPTSVDTGDSTRTVATKDVVKTALVNTLNSSSLDASLDVGYQYAVNSTDSEGAVSKLEHESSDIALDIYANFEDLSLIGSAEVKSENYKEYLNQMEYEYTKSDVVIKDSMEYEIYSDGISEVSMDDAINEYRKDLATKQYTVSFDPFLDAVNEYKNYINSDDFMAELDQYLSIFINEIKMPTEGVDLDLSLDLKPVFDAIVNYLETPLYQVVIDALYEQNKTLDELKASIDEAITDETTLFDILMYLEGGLPEGYTFEFILNYTDTIGYPLVDLLKAYGLVDETKEYESSYKALEEVTKALKISELVPLINEELTLANLKANFISILSTKDENGEYITLKGLVDQVIDLLIMRNFEYGDPSNPTDEEVAMLQQLLDAIQMDAIIEVIKFDVATVDLAVSIDENYKLTSFSFGFEFVLNIEEGEEVTTTSSSANIALELEYDVEKEVVVPTNIRGTILFVGDDVTLNILPDAEDYVVNYKIYNATLTNLSIDLYYYNKEGNYQTYTFTSEAYTLDQDNCTITLDMSKIYEEISNLDISSVETITVVYRIDKTNTEQTEVGYHSIKVTL